ncbi:Protein F52E1.13 d [Aphelenchoides avenae]|nr:Protein F52E1.13 d [Aphelenchus avenae]
MFDVERPASFFKKKLPKMPPPPRLPPPLRAAFSISGLPCTPPPIPRRSSEKAPSTQRNSSCNPELKMNYEVRDTDTLEGIAAAHDCTVGELVKMNKMHSRMVFPGQKMIVPPLKDDDVFISEKDPKDKDPEPPKPNAPAARIPHHLKSTVRSQSVKENCSGTN